ncbi:MAG: hypothetical protein ACPIOQ_38275 [Promethearchaeia archaeon]
MAERLGASAERARIARSAREDPVWASFPRRAGHALGSRSPARAVLRGRGGFGVLSAHQHNEGLPAAHHQQGYHSFAEPRGVPAPARKRGAKALLASLQRAAARILRARMCCHPGPADPAHA